MSDTSRARPLAETLAAMAALTPAQHALLERISHHATPVTVAELAQEAGLHVSSVRETLEGLFALGLVEKQQLPSSGRGRPALGYSTMTPADPSFAAQMLHQLTSSLLAWLRVDAADPAASVREIGSRWADAALETMAVPDHSHNANRRPVRDTFNIASHLGKVRLFMNAMGFASVPHDTDPMAVVLTACPFTEPGRPRRPGPRAAPRHRRASLRADGDRLCHLVTGERSRGSPAPDGLYSTARRGEPEAAVDDPSLLRWSGRGCRWLHARTALR